MSHNFIGRCLPAPLVLTLFACNPQVPIPHWGAPKPETAAEGAAEGGVVVTVEPSASLDAVPAVLRLRVAAARVAIDPSVVVLVQGHAGPAHLRQVQRGELSAALTERQIPALIFPDPPAEDAVQPSGVVVAPTVALTPGERYALLIGEPPEIVEIKVSASDPTPVLERLWPPLGSSATASLGVWCGREALAEVDEPIQLAPDGQQGRMQRGVAAGDLGQRCVRFEAAPDEATEGGVPPPVLLSTESAFLLDPRPLSMEAEPAPLTPVACAMDELAFGPGCARIFDDRLAARSPNEPALWSVQGDSVDRVFTTAAGEPFVIQSLPASSTVSLSIAVVDNGGQALRAIFSAPTLPPMAHVVLNEVFANPIGPEPAQEWVEIVNDGAVPAELDGYVLGDIGGETVLPAATLLPGSFALIVNEGFVEDDDYDPAPAPSTLMLRVPKLGQAGLANGGEPLMLRDAAGTVVSRFPAGPKLKAGMSVSRRDPGVPDAQAQEFVATVPTPGRPNEP